MRVHVNIRKTENISVCVNGIEDNTVILCLSRLGDLLIVCECTKWGGLHERIWGLHEGVAYTSEYGIYMYLGLFLCRSSVRSGLCEGTEAR